MRKAVIVIPTYNEAGNMKEVFERVFEATKEVPNWNIEILVVDSSSTDKTGKVIKDLQKRNPKIHLLTTEKEGLGKAYIHGFAYAIEKLNAYLLFEMDADLSHDPKEIPLFLQKIEKGADFVIGSRYIKGGSIPQDWGIHRKIFSTLGNIIIRYGFMHLKITDWTDGYRAIKAWVVKDSMSHIKHYSGYVFQIALLDYAVKNKASITEIPIHFKEREYGISKINALQYITHILLYVFTHSSFIKFMIVGLVGFVLDAGLFYYLIKYANFAKWHANLISTEIAVVSNFILNNYWSFSHKKLTVSRLQYIFNFLKFNLISSGSIVIQTVGVELGHWLLHIQQPYEEEKILGVKIAIILFVVIPYSYFFYNKFIWKEK